MNKQTFERRKEIKKSVINSLHHIWWKKDEFGYPTEVQLTEEVKKSIWNCVKDEFQLIYANGYRSGLEAGIIKGVIGRKKEGLK